MNLNQGGVAPSKPNSNSFSSSALAAIVPTPPRTKSTDSQGKKKKNKRKKDEVEVAAQEGEKESASLSSIQKKSRIDSTPQGILPSPTDRSVRSRTPVSWTRSTSGEDEDDENSSMMPPPSHHSFTKLRPYSARSEIDEFGYREYTSPDPQSPERKTVTSYDNENDSSESVQEALEREKREETDGGGEEEGEYQQTGLSSIVEEESHFESFISSPVEAQSEGGGRFTRFKATSQFGSTRFASQVDGQQTSVFPPPAAQAQTSPDSPTTAAPSPVAARDDERSHTPPDNSEMSEPKVEIDPLDPIPSLFPGSNPFLRHAKALARSKEIESGDDSSAKAEEVVEKVQLENVEFGKRFENILAKTQSLFDRSLKRQNELVAKLEEHSTELAKQEEQISETKQRLSKWSSQLLSGGDS